jgi:hypothetical protein
MKYNERMNTKTHTSKARPIEDKQAIAANVFNGMRSGMSAYKACVASGVPQSTFNHWLNDDATMAVEYARAREDLQELIASQIMEIADQAPALTASGSVDTGAVQKQKLQIDTRRWLLSKLAPKKYGDKLEVSGDAANPIAIQRIERVIVK